MDVNLFENGKKTITFSFENVVSVDGVLANYETRV